MKKLIKAMMISTSLIAAVYITDSLGAVTPEELAKNFTKGLANRSAFEEMGDIFLGESDFETFVRMLQNNKNLKEETRKLVNSREEIDRAKRAFLNDLINFKNIWDSGIKKIKDNKLLIEYISYTVKTETRDGLPCHEININFQSVITGKRENGAAKVTAFILEGRLKIAEFHHMKI